MRMKYLVIVLFLCLQSLALTPACRVRVVPFPSLPQLPVSAVHRIFQDSEGYMWYGTVNGLCRDDGYRVRIYRSDINTPGLLDDNTIQCIAEDLGGRIWFGSDHGAYILDKQSGAIAPLDSARLRWRFVGNMYRTSGGQMWLAVGSELLRYDASGRLLGAYPMKDRRGNPSWLSGFCENRQKEILISTYRGAVFRYDKEQDRFLPYAEPPEGVSLTCLVQDRTHDFYWAGTNGSGVLLFNPLAERGEQFVCFPLPRNSMGEAEGNVLFVVQDDCDGLLWATTRSDLIALRYDEQEKQLRQTGFRLPVRGGRMLNEICKDNRGALWVASFDEQSFVIRFAEDAPEEYALPALRERTAFNPAIMALCDAGERKMWISQERTGVGLYDLANEQVRLYSDFAQLARLPLGVVKLMYPSRRKGNVWVVPENRDVAYELSRRGMEMELRQTVDGSGLSPRAAFTRLYEDKQGLLWIGTNRGICLYDPAKKSLRTVCDTLGPVSSIEEGGKGVLWIGTNGKGLYRMGKDGRCTPCPTPRAISCLAVPEPGRVWIGTQEGGVYEFSPADGALTDHTRRCGLDGNIVNQLVDDVYGHIWVGTNQKLVEYNPANHSFSSYPTADGSLLLHRFIPTAVCRGGDGRIYFGGIPGICAVTPSDRLNRPSPAIRTRITGLWVMGKEREGLGGELVLRPGEYDLQIAFSSLDHLNARKVRYAYRLKGLDEDWTCTDEGANTAIYKHLPKGHFVFEVKATDDHGLWSKEITRLRIERLPAFYESGWAMALYAVAGIGILGAGGLLYVRRVKRSNDELYADSRELMKMREYLRDGTSAPRHVEVSPIEFARLDELLRQKVLKAVEENLSEPDFDVAALAREVGMSRSSLTRKLKAITGLTPLEYIRKVKMQHACRLLDDPEKTVGEVALALGYFNRKYFTACFKEEFGQTPSEYQKHHCRGDALKQEGGTNE